VARPGEMGKQAEGERKQTELESDPLQEGMRGPGCGSASTAQGRCFQGWGCLRFPGAPRSPHTWPSGSGSRPGAPQPLTGAPGRCGGRGPEEEVSLWRTLVVRLRTSTSTAKGAHHHSAPGPQTRTLKTLTLKTLKSGLPDICLLNDPRFGKWAGNEEAGKVEELRQNPDLCTTEMASAALGAPGIMSPTEDTWTSRASPSHDVLATHTDGAPAGTPLVSSRGCDLGASRACLSFPEAEKPSRSRSRQAARSRPVARLECCQWNVGCQGLLLLTWAQ